MFGDRTSLEMVQESAAPEQALMLVLLDFLRDEGFAVSAGDFPLLHVDLAGRRFPFGVGAVDRRQVRELEQQLSHCQELLRSFR